MKIGILSMQKISNYGSFLQALSLKKQFEQQGHDVYFIDILPGKQICNVPKVKRNLLKKFDKHFLKRVANVFFGKKMSKIHVNDYETYLNTSKVLSSDEKFDLVVIGSDEVFNATVPSPWGFTTQLFGEVKNTKRVVSYAASCGSTTFETAKEFEIVDEISNAMKNFEFISVRDENTADFVKKITGNDAILNVDPVFISDFDEYVIKQKRKKPYMLIYAYENRICDKGEIRTIKNYAKKHKLDIISVGMQQRWCNHNIVASAFQLLAYVKNADCIVTDTFHGTVFSIKYNKKFVALIRESNKNKLGGLLKQFKLDTRNVDNLVNFESTLDSDIDYNAVNKIIEFECQKAYRYLDMVIKEKK